MKRRTLRTFTEYSDLNYGLAAKLSKFFKGPRASYTEVAVVMHTVRGRKGRRIWATEYASILCRLFWN